MEQENMVFSEDEAIVEAVLFTMGKSVDVRQLAAALGRDVESAKDAAARLKERYEREQSWRTASRCARGRSTMKI